MKTISASLSIALSLLVGAFVAASDERVPPILLVASNDMAPTAPPRSSKPEPAAESTARVEARAARPLLWTPRTDRGAPALREGGATRGVGVRAAVQLLVPRVDAAALTLSAQPVLYWRLSEAAAHAIHFTLVDPDAIEPLVETELSGPFEAGIHATALADFGVELAAGPTYEWYVAIVPDADQRSLDTVARGAIVRLDEPELAERVARSSDGDDAIRVLAEAGVWYDALDRTQRAAQGRSNPTAGAVLLRQVGLELDVE